MFCSFLNSVYPLSSLNWIKVAKICSRNFKVIVSPAYQIMKAIEIFCRLSCNFFHATQNIRAKYSRMDEVKFFKGCLPQLLLGPFLNTLSHIPLSENLFKGLMEYHGILPPGRRRGGNFIGPWGTLNFDLPWGGGGLAK